MPLAFGVLPLSCLCFLSTSCVSHCDLPFLCGGLLAACCLCLRLRLYPIHPSLAMQGVVSTNEGKVVRAFHRFTLVDQAGAGRDMTKGRTRDAGAVKISCARQVWPKHTWLRPRFASSALPHLCAAAKNAACSNMSLPQCSARPAFGPTLFGRLKPLT